MLSSGFTPPTNSTLFLLRIYGGIHGSKFVIGFFSVLCLSTFTSFVGALYASASAIDPTECCVVESSSLTVSPAFIVPAAYDTLVFLAITWRVVIDSPAEGWRDRTSLFFYRSEDGAHHISRVLLQNGQVYHSQVPTLQEGRKLNVCGLFELSHSVAATPNIFASRDLLSSLDSQHS